MKPTYELSSYEPVEITVDPFFFDETPVKQQLDELAKNSVILLEQIRTIDKRRLKEKMGHLDDRTMKQVNEALYVSFGLTEETAVSSPA